MDKDGDEEMIVFHPRTLASVAASLHRVHTKPEDLLCEEVKDQVGCLIFGPHSDVNSQRFLFL